MHIYIYIPTQAFHSRLGGASWCCAPAALPGYTPACRALPWLGTSAAVAVAQLAARRSHNPKVVSSILTCHIELHKLQNLSTTLGRPGMVYDTPRGGTIKYARPLPGMQKRKPSPCLGDQLLPWCMGSSQFAQAVKGVDLRSTAGNCARVTADVSGHRLVRKRSPRQL